MKTEPQDSAATQGIAVLIVEDEFLIRMSAVDLVEAAGFNAVEASNADEAVALLDGNVEVAILFTDVDMPGSMDGLELARRVSRTHPGIRVIVGSGHRRVAASDLPEGALFFPKPYDFSRLSAALQQLVA